MIPGEGAAVAWQSGDRHRQVHTLITTKGESLLGQLHQMDAILASAKSKITLHIRMF